jgi:type I restriction-modification system DNA methylase subunit
MPIKKSELYSSLWKSCDELRGGMDASQYKDYVLVLLFVKYVSDKYAGQKNALLDVPKGGRFADMVALKGDNEIGDRMNKVISKLAEANDLKGVIDVADFNDADKLGEGKEMVDRLSNLVAIFDNPSLDFSANRAEGDDLLGDAYEYLMRHFATESGKSKGQFYTPAEVSRVMAKVVGAGTAKSASQIRRAAPARFCSTRTMKPGARPGSTSRSTAGKRTTRRPRWSGGKNGLTRFSPPCRRESSRRLQRGDVETILATVERDLGCRNPER